jgi:glycosyltransferase involved in cell wall biosynthesis
MAVVYSAMRILYLSQYYWPHTGGRERVVQDLAEEISALGHDVEVVAVQTTARGHERGRPRSRVTRVFSFGTVASRDVAPGYLAAAWHRADIIHVHHPHALADLAVTLRARRTPVVVTQHADARRPIERPLARHVLKRAKAVVVPSRAHIALCRDLEGLEGKVEVIPFGVDESRWTDLPPPAMEGPVRALFIGRLVRYKGVDVLLRALERVPEVRLDIVGTGPEAPRLRTLAQALAVTDRVRWYGEYPDEDLPRRMAEAHFLVLPSVSVEEMFGLVVIEAMAAGRPVITTDLPSGVREVNVHDQTGLVVPLRDPEALAQAMGRLASDPALRARLGAAGRERMQALFTRRRMAEQHVALYERILANRKL